MTLREGWLIFAKKKLVSSLGGNVVTSNRQFLEYLKSEDAKKKFKNITYNKTIEKNKQTETVTIKDDSD